MARSRKHNFVPPASWASGLIRISVVTFWPLQWGKRKTLFNNVFFSTEETKKMKSCLFVAGFKNVFTFLFETVFPLQHVMWTNIPHNHDLLLCNYAQAIEWHVFHCVSVCKWMFAFTTAGYTAIILLSCTCHVRCNFTWLVCLTSHFVVDTSQYLVEKVKYWYILYPICFISCPTPTPKVGAHSVMIDRITRV